MRLSELLVHLVSLLLAIAHVHVHAATKGASDFPNPEKDPEACRSRFSRICDPDGLLGDQDKTELADHIKSFEETTPLVCSGPGSKLNDDGDTVPVQVAIAIVQNMDLGRRATKDDAAQALAMGIHDAWGVGSDAKCGGTGILVFLSIDDRAIFISTGSAAQKALTHDRLEEVIEHMGPLLRKQRYGEALINSVDEMKAFVEKGPPSNLPLLLILGGFLSFVAYGVFRDKRQRRQYAEARSQLTKLDRDRALAKMGKYKCTSCAICLRDFNAPGGSSDDERVPLSGVDAEAGRANGVEERDDEATPTARLPTIGSDGRSLKLLRCGHAFDMSCWEQWIGSGYGDPRQCPICKQDVGGSPPPPPSMAMTNGDECRSATATSPGLYQASARTTMEQRQRDALMDAFNLERTFRLEQLSNRYPRIVSRSDVERWTAPGGYDGTLANDPDFVRNDPNHHSGSSSSRSGGGSSFGGGSSAGGCGGTW